MQNSDTHSHANSFDLVRIMMLQDQFSDVSRTIGDIATVVPIKGIQLLHDIYAEHADRQVNDIDLVVLPCEQLPEAARRLLATGNYRLKSDLQVDDSNILAKKKVCLLSTNPLLTDVDLHGSFSTKKFFRLSCPDYNRDAIGRLTPQQGNVRTMDPVDHWLFLATHACFHMFGQQKWVRDLLLLQRQFSPEQLETLDRRIRQYGFDRVAWAAYTRMAAMAGDEDLRMSEPQPVGAKRFRRFIINFHTRERKGLGRALTNRFYEFVHIGRARQRRRVYLKLMLPSLSMLRNIYNIKSPVLSALMYPLHILVSALTITAFHAYYLALSRPKL